MRYQDFERPAQRRNITPPHMPRIRGPFVKPFKVGDRVQHAAFSEDRGTISSRRLAPSGLLAYSVVWDGTGRATPADYWTIDLVPEQA